MAKAGLSFTSPMLGAMDLDALPNPYDASPDIGMGSLGGTLVDEAMLLGELERGSQFNMPDLSQPRQPEGPQVLYSPSTNKMFVNGALFDADDASSALQSRDYLTAPSALAPADVQDWQTVSPESYAKYIRNIEDPSLGNLAARNFEIGGSNLKLLAGRGAQFLGAEETGQDWVNSAISELYYNQPFQREFTEIDSAEGVLDWFVANLAQQGPNIIESIGTGLIGAGVGAVAGGGANPFTAVGGALAALTGRTAFKQAVLAAARKYAQGQALTVGERKLLREVAGLTAANMVRNPSLYMNQAGQALTRGQLNRQIVREGIDLGADIAARGGRNQAIAGGAALGNLAGSYAMGVADIYGETRDTGVGGRAEAALGAIPYAALESLPEFILGLRILGGGRALGGAMQGGNVLRRGATGFAVGGTLEGATEVGQESLLLGLTDQFDLSDEEVGRRLINSFAAGFAVGGPMGAGANMLKRGQPTDMLNEGANPEPTSTTQPIDPNNPTPNPLVPTGGSQVNPFVYEGEVVGPEMTPAGPPLPSPVQQGAALPAPPPVAQPVGSPPDFVAGQEGVRAGTQADSIMQVNQNIPPQAQGQQGVLDIFGGEPVSNQELSSRMDVQQQPAAQTEIKPQPAIQQAVDQNQMALPLEDPIVAATKTAEAQQQDTVMAQRLREAAAAKESVLVKEAELARKEAELAREEARLERERAQRQREFDLAMQQRQQEQIREMQAAQVEQMLAENEAQVAAQEAAAMPTVPVPVRSPQQLPLFPQGTLPRVSYADKLRARRAAAAETNTQEQVAEPMTPAEARAAGQGILFTQRGQVSRQADQGVQDAVQEQGAAGVDVRQQTETGQEVRGGDGQQQQTATKGAALKRVRKAQSSEIQRQETQVPTDRAGQEIAQQQPAQPEDQQGQDNVAYDSPYEAWADLAPEGAVELDRIPVAARDRFVAEVEAGRASIASTEQLYNEARGEIQLTALEELDEAISFLDTATDDLTFRYAAETLLDMAFFDTDSNLTKPTAGGQASVRDRATAYLENTEFSHAQRRALDDAFITMANSREKNLEATRKGKTRAWFTYAAKRELLNYLTVGVTNPPKGFEYLTQRQQQAKAEDAPTSVEDLTPEAATNWVDSRINSLLSGNGVPNITASNLEKQRNILAEKFAEADPEHIMARGTKLKDFFDADGMPYLYKNADGFYMPSTRAMTQAEERDMQAAQRSARAALRAEEREEQRRIQEEMARETRNPEDIIADMSEDEIYGTMDSSEEGFFSRTDTNKPAEKLDAMKLKAAVNKFLKGLRVKPKVTVVKDLADLKAKHPELYARAAASRPQGDFDTVAGNNAQGFSVGDEIIIFGDKMRSEQQVKFVLAHETMGHFGFRAFLPKERLDMELKKIYKSDGHIRAVVDRQVAQGMPMMEAIEEAVADKIALLETSKLAKLFAMLKNALNKFGFSFEDDVTRYLMTRARKNLRTNNGIVGAGQLAKNLRALQFQAKQGRFSVEEDRADLGRTFFAMHGLNRRAGAFDNVEGFKKFASAVFNVRTAKDFGGLLGRLLEEVQTLDNKASRNEGLGKIFHIFQDAAARTRTFLTDYENRTKFSHSTAATTEMKEQAGQLLAYAAAWKGFSYTDSAARDIGDLVVVGQDGTIAIDPRVFAQLEAVGSVSREQFARGIPYTDEMGNQTIWTPEFEITDDVWRIYTEQRSAINKSAIDVLESNIGAILEQREDVIKRFKKFVGVNEETMTSLEVDALRKIIAQYETLYYENMQEVDGRMQLDTNAGEKAQAFIAEINRALYDERKMNDWRTNNAARDGFTFPTEQYQDIINGLERLAALNLGEDAAYSITNDIQALSVIEANVRKSEMRAKQTIMGAYVPFNRRGKYQVQIKAVDSNGNVVELADEYADSLPFFIEETSRDADTLAEEISAIFQDQQFTVPVKIAKGTTEERAVTFRVERSTARNSKPVTDNVDLTQMTNVMSRLGININPQARKRLILELTNQDANIRKRSLKRTRKAGWDKDVVRGASEYLETQAHIAGKTYYSHKMNNIMIDDDLWMGDERKMKNLTDDLNRKREQFARGEITPEALRQAEEAFDKYAFQYRESAPVGATPVQMSGETEPKPNKGRGREYQEEARKLIAWYSSQGNIIQSTEDALSGETGSNLKMAAVLLQLGGNIATAAINAVSMVTHSVPYLATYNAKRGFGGGFGMGAAGAAMTRAARDMGNKNLANAAYLEEVVNSEALQQKHNITADEAQFLLEVTREGVLQAAQFNALVGTSRGGWTRNNKVAKGVEVWMSAFTYTEQLNRRATALAAYRLERDRAMTAFTGEVTPEQRNEANDRAAEFARLAVNKSQGEYAMYNRPEMARGNFLQYIFMYKQFLIITVQMMRNLNRKEQMIMLGMLFLMSGLKGLPFGDDLMDLIDTIAQRFGIPMASIEKEVAMFVDELIPGASPLVMRGALDYVTGLTFSSRLGFGDLIPMSGALKVGLTAEDYLHEAENFLGPVWGGVSGLVQTGWGVAGYGAQLLGLTTDRNTSIAQVFRESPIAGIRNLVDGFAYLSDGAITNKQGKIVAEDATVGEAVGRMLGFYPSRATLTSDAIRIGRQVDNYTGAIRSRWVSQYARAMVSGDRTEARNILRMVNDWNREWRGTEFELQNFRTSADRAYQAARMPSAARFTKFAPRNVRPEMQRLMEIYGID